MELETKGQQDTQGIDCILEKKALGDHSLA